VHLTLPLPPSANKYWRNVKGRVLLSKEARQYREHCMTVAAVQWKRGPLRGRVKIHADVFMDLRGDLMNREKQLLDALQGVVLLDDAQVWEMTMVRHLDRDDPRVELEVSELAA
jgi:crossover junction endodeoxyribonuclease RusA